jgi:hypothetical protein
MRAGGGWSVLRLARAIPAVVLAVVLALTFPACGTSPSQPTAVPTFPDPEQETGASTGPDAEAGVVPDDCTRILAAPDLEAVLGLPLGSVGVRTTIGVPSPSVGRTERLSCDYTRVGDSAHSLLDVNATAYVDAEAALDQWRINVDAESGESREVPLGSAHAVLFEKDDEAVLMIAHSTSNLTLVLPDQPLPGGRSRVDVAVDLALRVLPAVSVEPTSAPPPVPGTSSAVVPQAGAPR